MDIVDVTMAAYVYGTQDGDANFNVNYDMDHDGDVDIVDITMVTYNYGWECGGKSTSNLKFDSDLNRKCRFETRGVYKFRSGERINN